MAFVYDLTDTWNAGGTTFNAIKMNVTDTASAAASRLVTLQVGGSERFGVDKAGNVLIGNGGDLQISSATGGNNSTIYNDAQDLYIATNGSTRMYINSSGNVGIGTSSPQTSIHIKSGGTTTARITDGTSAANLDLIAASSYVQVGTPNGAPLLFQTSATERMRIDSSGRVGIGNTAPGYRLDVTAGDTTAGLGYGMRLRANATANGGSMQFTDNGVTSQWAIITASSSEFRLTADGRPMTFYTGGSERARVDSSGNLLVGTTTQLASTRQTVVSGGNGVAVQVANGAVGSYMTNTSGTGDWQPFSFNVNGTSFTQVGSITITGGTTTNYNTSSDYRLKDIDGPIQNSGDYIDALKPVHGSWKSNGSRFIGLLAHEVQEVSETQIATGEKDGEEMQAMDYSAPEIIANLIAEIQSLRARVAQLETSASTITFEGN